MAASWDTLGERLRWAIEQQPSQGRRRGLRLFQSRMEQAAPDVAGTSLTAIQGYLRGDAEPAVAFVEVASRLLNIRPAWLAFGIGAPTEAEEASRQEAPEERLARVSQVVREALGVATFTPPAIWAPIVQQLMYAQRGHRGVRDFLAGRGGFYGDDEALADAAAAIAAPLRVLDIDAVGLSPVELAHFVQAVSLALQRAIQSNPDHVISQEADDA